MKKNFLLKLIRSLSGRTSLPKTLAMLVLFILISNNAFAQISNNAVAQTSGAALNFDGLDDYVEVGKILPATYTKEAWINASAFSTQTNILSGGSDGLHALWAPSGYLSAGHNSSWKWVSDPTPLALNTWYHIAVTYDSATTTMKLYKNGVLVSTNTGVSPFRDGNALRIGAYTPAANLFQGSIDEVRIWSRVLSQTEIQNRMSCELPSGQTGLVAYYKFNQGIDNANNSAITTLTDASGNSNTGTLTNFGLNGLTSNWVAPGAVMTIDPPTAVAQTFCGSKTIADLVATGTALQWYADNTTTAVLPSITSIATGTYYVSQTINSCESARTAVTITVNTTPTPTGLSTQVYAGVDTLESLTATGTEIQWYDAATAGTLLANSTTLVDGTTYYASQTVSTCESNSRLAVTVQKISESTQTFCDGATVAGLVSTPSAGATAAWFTTPIGGTALGSTDTLATATYYVEQTPVTIVSTFAGSGEAGATDDTGAAASFNYPTGVAVDGSGNVYVADFNNKKIRKITAAGVVSTLAGSGAFGATDGIGAGARFNFPSGVAVDGSGNVYVADYQNNKIRKITPAGVVSTLAGSGAKGSTDGTGAAASFNNPYGVAVDGSGNVYVADLLNQKIRKITPAGVVSTLAGSGTAGATDGTGAAASFNYPSGVAVDGLGNVYVADQLNQKIRKITPAGVVSTLAGSGAMGSTDGTGAAASFNSPYGVAVDGSGNVYVADQGNSKIRKITPAGVVITLAGSGTQGATDGTGETASFFFPTGVAIDGSGNVYVADTTNNKIRKIVTVLTSNRVAVNVTVNTTAAPTGIASQTFCGSETVSLLNVTGTGIVWYDAATLGTIVPDATVLVDGTTYYASQTIDDCESTTRFAVTASVGTCLGLSNFDATNLQWYPNPTTGKLNINYSKTIEEVSVVNLLGQTLYTNKPKANEVQLDLSKLPTATYFIKVVSDGKSKIIKVIKQ